MTDELSLLYIFIIILLSEKEFENTNSIKQTALRLNIFLSINTYTIGLYVGKVNIFRID